MSQPTDILDFWFEGVDAAGENGPPGAALRWFRADPKLDATIRERFGADIEAALAGDLDAWRSEPLGRIALVILLDQFTRNVFRGEARSFAGDAQALALAREAVEQGIDRSLRPVERHFLYLPFEHAEDPVEQARAVALYGELAESVSHDPSSLFSGALEWALRHRVVIDRFGRFPSRNAALGRESTAEEIAFLEETPTGF